MASAIAGLPAEVCGECAARAPCPRRNFRSHRSSADATVRITLDLPNHGGFGNPSTNEEVTMATAKKKAPAKKAAKKKGKKK